MKRGVALQNGDLLLFDGHDYRWSWSEAATYIRSDLVTAMFAAAGYFERMLFCWQVDAGQW